MHEYKMFDDNHIHCAMKMTYRMEYIFHKAKSVRQEFRFESKTTKIPV